MSLPLLTIVTQTNLTQTKKKML